MKNAITIGAIAALSGSAFAGISTELASTSFENGFVGDQYVDTGDASMDHGLVNNAGQSSVNFVNDGFEVGFSAYYRNTRGDVGLTDGDFVGFTDFTGVVGSYTDGVQGYQMQDADGLMGIQFDTIGSTSFQDITMDVFVQETGWESDDSIRIWAVVDGGVEVDLLNTIGSDIDDLLIEGSWLNLSADLSGYLEATLFVELESNSASEAIFIDNVVWNGAIPTPGAASLLAFGGLVASRRRRA